jgi:hypothetical protein
VLAWVVGGLVNVCESVALLPDADEPSGSDYLGSE